VGSCEGTHNSRNCSYAVTSNDDKPQISEMCSHNISNHKQFMKAFTNLNLLSLNYVAIMYVTA
jgi:hypothetical protein